MYGHKRLIRLFTAAGSGIFFLTLAVILLGTGFGKIVSAQSCTSIVTGDITGNVTWSLAGSPYCIQTGTVFINNGAALVIEPGVQVIADDGTGLEVDDGQLIATGTAAAPIHFYPANATPTRGIWRGIQVNNTTVSTISHTIIDYAYAAVRVDTVNQPVHVLSSTIRYAGKGSNGSAEPSGAIIGSSDQSLIRFNTIYSSDLGINLNEAGGNQIGHNVIYDIIEACITVGNGGTGSQNNAILDNHLFNCGTNAIRLVEGTPGQVGVFNQVVGNVISNTTTGAIFLDEQSTAVVTNNVVYQVAAGSGLVFDWSGGFPPNPVAHSNAFCVDGPYEIDNQYANQITAEGNWLGTNNPQVGTEINGNVDFTPFISLTADLNPPNLPADGSSSSILTIRMQDGQGHTVPPIARVVKLEASAGVLADTSLTLDANGVASTTLTAPNIRGTAVITASPFCGSFSFSTTLDLQEADLAISKTTAATQVIPGDLITYTITYTNNGNIAAQNAVITDLLPTGTTWVSDNAVTQGFTRTPLVPTTAITWELGAVGAGVSNTIMLVAQVGTQGVPACTPGGGPLVNQVSISAPTLDNDSTNNSATDAGLDCNFADLSISKSASTIPPSIGKVITFTISYANNGNLPAADVVITDTLHPLADYVGDTAGVPPVTSPTTVSWALGTLGVGQSGSFDIGVIVSPNIPPTACDPGTGTLAITNAVQINSSTLDLTTSDNFTQTTAIQIPCTPDLVVVKNDGVGPGSPVAEVLAGNVFTYTINVVNIGAFSATNTVLTETLPANTSFVGPAGWVDVGGGQYTYSVGDLGSFGGDSVLFIVRVDQGLACNVSEVFNTVTTGNSAGEADPSDNISHENTPVRCRDLALTKDDGGLFCAIPGQLIDYHITVTNTQAAASGGLTLVDAPSAGLTFQGPIDGTWSGSGPYTHNLGTLNGNETRQIPFSAQIDPGLSAGITIVTNVVTLNPGNLTAFVTTPIDHNIPDLWVIKNDNIELLPRTAETIRRVELKMGPVAWLDSFKQLQTQTPHAQSVSPGDVISYTIGYGNAGGAAASNVVITETLPDNTTFVGPAYWVHLGGNTYVYTLTTLLAQNGGQLDFRVRVNDPFPTATSGVTNTVQIGADHALECDPSDNISLEFTPVHREISIYLPIILVNYPPAQPPTPTPTPTQTSTPTPTPTPLPLAWVSDVAADPTTNQIFIASPREDAVHVIDGPPADDTYKQAVPVGHGPTGLTVLTATTPSKVGVAHAYALNDWRPGVWFIPSDTLQPHPMADDGGYVGAAPVKIAANSMTDRFYVSNYFDLMPVLNAGPETRWGWVKKKNFQASYGIAISPNTNLVYMAAIDTGELIIFDAAQAEANPFISEAQPGYGACHNAPPDADGNGSADPRIMRLVAVNPTTGHVFVSSPPDPNPALNQTTSQIFVLDEATLIAEAQARGGPLSDVTCNWNFSGRVQVPTALPGKGWVRTVTLPGAVAAGEEGLAVSPITGKVYITDSRGDQLFILQDDADPANISLITTVPVGDNPQGVGVNIATNKAYVANARDIFATYGTVDVIDGTANTVIKTIPLTATP